MKKGLVSGLVLLIIGIVCGALLAGINAVTAPIIKANADQKVLDSLNDVYPNSSNYDLETIEEDGDVSTLFVLSDKTSGDTVAIIYSVSAYGYQSDVSMLIAVEKNNENQLLVVGYTVVSQGETSGIGDQIVGHDFKMDGKVITDLATFDAVSGASYSSGAVRTCFESVGSRAQADFGGAN